MSYILDALRRADAERERERGDVPGLHSQPMAPEPAAGASSIAPWVAAAVLAGAGVSGAWWWFSRTADAPVAAATPSTAPAPTPTPAPTPMTLESPAPVAAPAAVAPPAPAAVMPTAPPAVAAAPRPPLAAAPPEAAPPPAPAVRERTRPPAPEPSPAAVAEAPPGPPAAAPAPLPTPTPTPTPTPPAVIAYEQLPEDVRRQLPAVAIGGAIYSDVPAARLLIVAGQLLREGDAVAPGITLEQIRPRSAILRWRALRYEMAF